MTSVRPLRRRPQSRLPVAPVDPEAARDVLAATSGRDRLDRLAGLAHALLVEVELLRTELDLRHTVENAPPGVAATEVSPAPPDEARPSAPSRPNDGFNGAHLVALELAAQGMTHAEIVLHLRELGVRDATEIVNLVVGPRYP